MKQLQKNDKLIRLSDDESFTFIEQMGNWSLVRSENQSELISFIWGKFYCSKDKKTYFKQA